MAKKDEQGYIHYTPEELARVPSYEERDRAGANARGNAAGAVAGAAAGSLLGATASPGGAIAGAVVGGALGGGTAGGNLRGGGGTDPEASAARAPRNLGEPTPAELQEIDEYQ